MRENNNDDDDEKIINDLNISNESSIIEKLTEANRGPSIYTIDNAQISPDTENAKKILGEDLINTVADNNLIAYEEEHLQARYKGFFLHE
jgi:hypothetical protein